LVDFLHCCASRNEEELNISFRERFKVIEIEQFEEEGNLIRKSNISGKHNQPREKFEPVNEQIIISIEALEHVLVLTEQLSELFVVDTVSLRNGLKLPIVLSHLAQ
jgi:hypothetical protein